MTRIWDDELFDINNIGNEKKIDQEEAHKDPIHPTLQEGNRFNFHGYL
jgi:hypothetical protein